MVGLDVDPSTVSADAAVPTKAIDEKRTVAKSFFT
jgi:hypothetical protein